MSASALSKLPEAGSSVRVLTYLQVSDSGVALYGFLSEEEKELFERLITVSGRVGPKVALAALSTFSPRALVDAVAAQDTPRSSRRFLVSEKDRLAHRTRVEGVVRLVGRLPCSLPPPMLPPPTRVKGATEALLSMGFTSAEAELALKGSPEGRRGETALLQICSQTLGESIGEYVQ